MRVTTTTTMSRLLLAIGLVLAVAACGNGATPSPAAPSTARSSSATTLKATFIARGNSLCTAANNAAGALTAPTLSGTTDKPAAADLPLIAAYYAQIMPIGRTLITGLRGLGEPNSDAALWHRALGAQELVLGDIQSTASAASVDDSSGYVSRTATMNVDTVASNKLMDQFGMTVCGSDSPSSPSPSAPGHG